MFFFLIIVQIICCISVFIVCGMANNMYYVEDTGKYSIINNNFLIGLGEEVDYQMVTVHGEGNSIIDTYYISKGQKTYSLDYSGSPSVSEILPLIEKISESIGEDFGFCVMCLTPNTIVNIKDTATPTEIFSSFPGNTNTVAGKIFENSNQNIFSDDNNQYSIGDTVTINGIEYSYVNTNIKSFNIPYKSLQDCFRVKSISIILTELPTVHRRTEIKNIINTILGTNIRMDDEPETYEPAERQISQMVYIISLVVMVIILFALAKFYSYVLSNRQNTLTVLRLCGGTKQQIHLIYMIEIFLTMIVTSALGFVIFKYLCYQPIAEMYPSFDVFFTPDIYITIIAAYIVLALIIMAITIIPTTKASIIDMKRG